MVQLFQDSLTELYGAIWLLDVSHGLGRGDDIEEHFLAVVTDDKVWSKWILVVVELHLLLILVDQVVL